MEDHLMDSVAGVSRGRQQAWVWSLVLSAARIPHLVVRGEDGWTVLVSAGDAPRARQEIAVFEQENRDWPPEQGKSVNRGTLPDRQPAVVPVMGAMIVFHAVTGPWQQNSVWFRQGAVSSDRIREAGEWWRLITALTLHADLVHVLGNALFGGLLAWFLCRQLGGGLAWLLILLSGALGNGINIGFHGPGYLSVGFSTAVFGTVGLLSGMVMARKESLKEIILPLGAAAGLLAFLGTEGKRTDLGAHLWGLVVGIGLGVMVAMLPALPRWALVERNQWLMWGLVVFTVIGAWWAALGWL